MQPKLGIKSYKYIFFFFFQNKHFFLFYCAIAAGNISPIFTYCEILDSFHNKGFKCTGNRKDSEESTSIKKEDVCAEFS